MILNYADNMMVLHVIMEMDHVSWRMLHVTHIMAIVHLMIQASVTHLILLAIV